MHAQRFAGLRLYWGLVRVEGSSTIQLPVYEGMSLQLTPAPLWKRVIAFAVDVAIIQLSFVLAILCLAVALGSLATVFQPSIKGLVTTKPGIIFLLVGALILLLMLVCVFDGYFIYFEWKKGATPGKRLMGLRVVPIDRGRLTLGQCALRDIMRWVDVGLLLPGILSIVLTQRKQRLGDIVAGTIVSHSAQEEAKQQYFYVKQDIYQWFLAKCSPTPPPLSDCEDFLKFAYPTFALETRRLTQINHEEIKQWEQYAVTRVPGLSELVIEQEIKLRLFAELCFQTKIRITEVRRT